MKQKTFLVVLAIITLFSLILRLKDYDTVPPVNEAFDEVFYAWGGGTWIKEGVPKSWSYFEQYKNVEHVEYAGINWRIVSPSIEKPPLYSLINGVLISIAGIDDVFATPHRLIRHIPLFLSIFTVFLVGLVARRIFDARVGILSSLIYATVPTIVLTNRLSLTENLLTPLLLLALLLLTDDIREKTNFKTIIIGILCALAVLTKQIGIFIPLGVAVIYFIFKKQSKFLIIVTLSAIGLFIYLAEGIYYGWDLFVSLQQQWRIAHPLSGLPEVIASIFRFQGIGPKNHPFIDGPILLGYLLLFTSPLLLKIDKFANYRNTLFLIFPFIYLILLAIGESGGPAFTFFGWYLYPLLPFVVILFAKFIWDFWQKPQFLTSALLFLVVGSSTIRFFFLLTPREFHYLWQYTFIGAILVFCSSIFLRKKLYQKILLAFFIVFIAVNILAIFNLGDIYQQVAVNDKSLEGFN